MNTEVKAPLIPCQILACTCPQVARSGIDGLHGMVANDGGGGTDRDAPKELDVISVSLVVGLCQELRINGIVFYVQNEIMKEVLAGCGVVRTMASEEDDMPVEVPLSLPPSHQHPGFAVVFDPLDGSRNIEVSIPTGEG